MPGRSAAVRSRRFSIDFILTDENCMTTREGVFAAGDVVHGSHTVVAAANEAKLAAAAMIAYMER